MLRKLLLLSTVFFAMALSAQCPSAGFAQVTEYQRAARVFLSGLNENVDSIHLYVGGIDYIQFQFDEPDTVYTIEPDGATTGYNIYELEPDSRYNLFAVTYCGGERAISQRQSFATEADGPPPNDTITNIGLLGGAVVRCVPQPGTTQNARPSDFPDNSCGGVADDDVWYRLRAIFPQYEVAIFPIGGTDLDVILQVYNAEGDILACVDEGGAGASEVFQLTNAVEGQDYRFRVFTKSAGTYSIFEICSAGAEPVPISEEVGCTQAPPVVVDGSGQAGQFIDVLDSNGGIILSIENTEDLGEVNASYYRTDGDLRQADSTGARYAGRNVSITPTTQPSDSVTVRFYLSDEEVQQFLAAGAISGIEDMEATKISAASCSSVYPGGGMLTKVDSGGIYGANYFLDVKVDAFSEFFFHPASQSLTTTTSLVDNARAQSPWTFGPNPVGNELRLVPPQTLTDREVKLDVFQADGRRLLTRTLPAGPLRRLPTADWAPGMYFIVLSSERERVTLRVVK